jgi:hypothetical protein
MNLLKLTPVLFAINILFVGCFTDPGAGDDAESSFQASTDFLSISPKTIYLTKTFDAEVSSGASGTIVLIEEDPDCDDDGNFIINLDTGIINFEVEGNNLIWVAETCKYIYEGQGNPYGSWNYQGKEGPDYCPSKYS